MHDQVLPYDMLRFLLSVARRFTGKLVPLLIVLGALSAGRALAQSPAATYAKLNYFFDSNKSNPSTLIVGSDGNLYGTTSDSQLNGTQLGSFFQLGTDGQVTTLYSQHVVGYRLSSAPIQGSNGDFYGTFTGVSAYPLTYYGGLYRVTSTGNLTWIYQFTNENPHGDLILGNDGNLYGVTGKSVFRCTPDGVLTTLYTFSARDANDANLDGSFPNTLVLASDGNFYGTTTYGGAAGMGTIFKISPTGTFTHLYSFDGSHGEYPIAALIQARDGNFYGTTSSIVIASADKGTVFKFTPDGSLTTLHVFNGSDGSSPRGSLLQASDGNFYGTTYTGGVYNFGTVFQLTPDGRLSTLHSFYGYDASSSQEDGGHLSTGLVQLPDGALYGTTDNTAYKLVVHPAFFNGQVDVGNGIDYLAFANGNFFGYYAFLNDPHFLYHFDLGYEYVFDAVDGHGGVYLYDFASQTFFYTSPTFPFPYLYDFTLESTLYYYPDPLTPDHYNSFGIRYFYDFATGKIITK